MDKMWMLPIFNVCGLRKEVELETRAYSIRHKEVLGFNMYSGGSEYLIITVS